MEKVLTREYIATPAETNAEQELSLSLLTAKIIDIATLHAGRLGIGNPDMAEHHGGWVLSRLTIEMTRYPKANEKYRLSTWIEDWNRRFSIRSFRVDDETGISIGYARSVWMIINTETHEGLPLDVVSPPEGCRSGLPCPIATQVKHVRILPYGSKTGDVRSLVATVPEVRYTFRYTDLDYYRHVNTIRYIELLLNCFSLSDFDEAFAGRLELSFLHEAVYAQEVAILRSDCSDSMLSSFSLVDAEQRTPILFARVERRLR